MLQTASYCQLTAILVNC
uniref:Uncharacterized protein n=1 Tax=Anguilla anguilla TaxID=7936 RepID=A0A0E9SB17_ANGAN